MFNWILLVIPVWICIEYWVNGKYMIVVKTDRTYKLLRTAFNSYRSEVINRKKLYDRYVDDFCVKHTRQVPDFLNKHGVVDSSNEKNCIRNRVQKLLETRPDLVHKYFRERAFNYKDYVQLVEEFDTTYPVQKLGVDLIELKQKEGDKLFMQDDSSNEKIIRSANDITYQTNDKSVQITEEQKTFVKERILMYISGENKIHLGHRIFGYLIKAKIFRATNSKQRLEVLHEFLGEDIIINSSAANLLYKPNYSRSILQIDQLEEIQIFFSEIGLHFVADIVSNDLVILKKDFS